MKANLSMAERMLKARGAAYCKQYLDPPADGCGEPCEYGHLECAHYKRGPCGNELTSLIGSLEKGVAA